MASTGHEIKQHVRGSGRVGLWRHLAETHVVEDEEVDAAEATQAALVGAVGEAGVEFGEHIGEAGEADGEAGVAGADRDGGEDVVGVRLVEGQVPALAESGTCRRPRVRLPLFALEHHRDLPDLLRLIRDDLARHRLQLTLLEVGQRLMGHGDRTCVMREHLLQEQAVQRRT